MLEILQGNTEYWVWYRAEFAPAWATESDDSYDNYLEAKVAYERLRKAVGVWKIGPNGEVARRTAVVLYAEEDNGSYNVVQRSTYGDDDISKFNFPYKLDEPVEKARPRPAVSLAIGGIVGFVSLSIVNWLRK